MTALDRFDPFAGRVTSALEEIAPASRPAYLDDVFKVTAGTRQRPRWTFIGRWLPMDTVMPRGAGRLQGPVRPLLRPARHCRAAGRGGGHLRRLAATRAGSLRPGRQRRTRLRAERRPVRPRLARRRAAAPHRRAGRPARRPVLVRRPAGRLRQHRVRGRPRRGRERRWVSPREILDRPFTGNSAAWSPDSRSMVLTIRNDDDTFSLLIAPADGSGAREVEVDGLNALDAVYNPADDGTLLIRGLDRLRDRRPVPDRPPGPRRPPL